MPKNTFPPTQNDIDEIVSDAVCLAEQLGFPKDEESKGRKVGRKSNLLANISLFTLMVLSINPVIEGWKR